MFPNRTIQISSNYFNFLYILGTCIFYSRIVFAEIDDSWIGKDCKNHGHFFYTVGNGKGSTKSIANQAALLDARKNALLCNFGGRIDFSAQTTESDYNTEFQSKELGDIEGREYQLV